MGEGEGERVEGERPKEGRRRRERMTSSQILHLVYMYSCMLSVFCVCVIMMMYCLSPFRGI